MSRALGGERGWAGLGWAVDTPFCRQRFNLGDLFTFSYLLRCQSALPVECGRWLVGNVICDMGCFRLVMSAITEALCWVQY